MRGLLTRLNKVLLKVVVFYLYMAVRIFDNQGFVGQRLSVGTVITVLYTETWTNRVGRVNLAWLLSFQLVICSCSICGKILKFFVVISRLEILTITDFLESEIVDLARTTFHVCVFQTYRWTVRKRVVV